MATNKTKNYQFLFENLILSPEQQLWCRNFENLTMYEPSFTEKVKDNDDFIEMCDKNVAWFEKHVYEITRQIEQDTIKLQEANV